MTQPLDNEADHRALEVPDGLGGERVDAAIAQLFGLSRTRAADLITRGLVELDGSGPAKSDRVLPGSTLQVTIPVEADPLDVVPEIVEGIRIIHDDDSIVVLDKPVGVAVHPSPGWSGPTVVGHLTAAGFRIATSGAPERQGIVQRLDVGTSGVMVICKSEHGYSKLKNAFRRRDVQKIYHALVQGHPDPLEGTIDAPIGRHPKADYKHAVMTDGRHSVTHYTTLEAHRFASLLEVELETGRTHQIRVHMAALKHPCVGDITYGADPKLAARLGLERQWLHAVRLGFEHPDTGKHVEYSSPYPAMPRGLHDAEDVRGWVSGWDLATNEVWLALAGVQPVGYVRVAADWLNDIYVDPAAQGTGVGSMLLDLVKSLRPGGYCLWVFESNTPARDFYVRRDLVELERTDGSGNEEKEPDIKMAWPGTDPLAFYRRLVDEVDGELAALLHRRVALTHAIQPHKGDIARDLEREREIAETMAHRAPLLGPERLERIVHAIITESLDAET